MQQAVPKRAGGWGPWAVCALVVALTVVTLVVYFNARARRL
jgi:hypothetical protein